ncbi:hypothetical protein [Streptomyces sp. JJ36]|uniref:hypothetical protein n=1 Tax=Streptomyces sp. JJ36 TaxID=2736645 RepID=UPI001F3253F9|nr:hypothetical protein [Streptomyces sp. JJ36]MCF6522443.1 hypothetical protein [Streptomyces sp. JJ36]
MTAEQTPPTDRPTGEPPAAPRADHRALLTEARRLSEAGHPAARAAWQRLDEAVRRGGVPLPGDERAELLDHRAMALARTDPAAATGPFREAAALYAAAGRDGDAVACRARALLATAFAGDARAALEGIAPLCSEALALHGRGRAATRHATAVLLTRARIRAALLPEAPDPDRAAAGLDAELAELVAFAAPHRQEPAVLARIAEATESRGRLARQRGDTATAAGLLAESARLSHEAGRPWQATEAELTLARLRIAEGAPDHAERLLRHALADPHRRGALDGTVAARLHLVLADALAAQQRAGDTAEAYREAARLAAAAGDAPGLGAYARLRLGGCLLDLGRDAEARDVLRDALPALLAGHDAGEVVRARAWLAEALSRAGDHVAAAAELLQAAEEAAGWPDQGDHAQFRHLAADSLADAGRPAEADAAYEQAAGLWRSLGRHRALAGALRSRAWLAMEAGDPSRAVDLMARALGEIEPGLRAAADEEARVELLLELGLTYRQTAELLLRTAGTPPDAAPGPERQAVSRAAYQEAVVVTDHAVAAFAQCGTAGLHERTAALLTAAWLELSLGLPDAAAARARTVLDSYPADGAGAPHGPSPDHVPPAPGARPDVAAERREEAAGILARARSQPAR